MRSSFILAPQNWQLGIGTTATNVAATNLNGRALTISGVAMLTTSALTVRITFLRFIAVAVCSHRAPPEVDQVVNATGIPALDGRALALLTLALAACGAFFLRAR